MYERIENELTQAQDYLEQIMPDHPDDIVERGAQLQVWIARSGKLLADSKLMLNEATQGEVMKILTSVAKASGASHTAVNALVKSSCRQEQYLVDWAERINRTATHQLEFLRSMLSKAKEEMRISAYQMGNVNNQ